MKKIFILLFPVLILCCSCSNENAESVSEAKSQSQSSSTTTVSSEISSFASEISPDNNYLGTVSGIDIYQKAVETSETRLILLYNDGSSYDSRTEVPATEYWIVDKDGNILINQPFYDFNFYPEIASFDDPPTAGIFGCYKGNYFRYCFINGKFERAEFHEAGVVDANEIIEEYTYYPDYVPIRYYYGKFERGFGIADREGNVIFEPVFSVMMEIPFKDRFIGYANNDADLEDDLKAVTFLMDKDKNVLSVYTSIWFHFFDDGTYIGIAWYAGHGVNRGPVLHDQNGDILKEGHRFIDKDGNELSPCFALFEIAPAGERDFIENYFDVPITAVDENGSTVEIKASDYVCKP